MRELEQAREVFLSDVDEDTRRENLEIISSWEDSIQRNSAYLDWKEHDITKEINKLIKEAYRDHAITLASNRALPEEERRTLWAKQDACVFLLNLTDQDAKTALDSVMREIKMHLSVTR